MRTNSAPQRSRQTRRGEQQRADRRVSYRSRAGQLASAHRTVVQARAGLDGLIGATLVVAALDVDEVEQVVVTRRFMERDDEEAKQLLRLATTRDVQTVVVDGLAALELDLFGDGAAARLRPIPVAA
jgi:hypothetical protein